MEIICVANWVVKCLEGTTERSDGNRARRARGKGMDKICLEGSTPKDKGAKCIHRRSAFQAHRLRNAYPRTSSPVTVASLRTAFQADYTPLLSARFLEFLN